MVLEEKPGWVRIGRRNHDIARPTAAIGNHRRAASLRFHGGDAEIFFRRENSSAGALGQRNQFGARQAALEGDIGRITGGGARLRLIRAIAHNDELAIRHGAKGGGNQVNALIGHDARRNQIVIALAARRREAFNIHRRVQHPRIAPPGFLDAFRDIA